MSRNLLICFLLAAATVAVYGQVIDFDYVNYDDGEYVHTNENITPGLTAEGVKWVFTHHHCANWHPLTGMSHMIDVDLFGIDPGRHHLTNLFFHVINTLLLFAVLNAMTRAPWKSAFVAALFALHPMHVESVAWVSARKDVLSTMFWLLATWAYAAYARRGGAGRYALVMVFMALGLMSKPMVVTLPMVFLLLDFWPLKRMSFGSPARDSEASGDSPEPDEQALPRQPLGRLIVEKIPLFALSAAGSIVTFVFQRGAGAVLTEELVAIPQRFANACVSYATYVVKTFWPSNLTIRYPHPYLPGGTPWEWWMIAGAALLMIAVTVLALLAHRKRYAIVGWLWFCGTLVPVIGLVQVGGEARADRYTYIPLIGLFVIIAWAVPDLVRRLPFRKPATAVCAAAVLAALMTATWAQAGHWENSKTLSTRAITVTSGNFLMHNCLGMAFADEERYEEALEQYLESIRIHPRYADAYNNMGVALGKLGRQEEADNAYSTALSIDPNSSLAHFNMGNALDKRGKLPEAIAHYLEALRIDPGFEKAHNNLGNVFMKQGKTAEAAERYSMALAIDPDYAEAHNNLGKILAKQGKLPEAIAHFTAALRTDPNISDAHLNFGTALAVQRKIPEAAHHFAEAVRLDPLNAQAHYNLANTMGIEGKTDEAVIHFLEAVRIDPDYVKAHFNLANTFARQGKRDEARRHFQEVLRIDPGNEPARQALDRLR